MKFQNPFRKQINIFLSRSLSWTSLATFTTVLTLGLPGPLAHAATFTWDGGLTTTNSNWGNAGNWVGDVTPTFNNEADIILTGIVRNGTILSGNRTVRSVTFNEPSIAFSIKTRANASATGGAANLIFSAVSGNGSITVAAGTAATTIDSGSVTGAGIGGGATSPLFFPASGPASGSFNGLHIKSKFLAVLSTPAKIKFLSAA